LGSLLIFFFGGSGDGSGEGYMLNSGSFVAASLQTIEKGVLDPRLPWSDTCDPRASTTRRPGSRIEDGEGAVAPRSTTDSTK
jgi:hypothetical protein